MTDQDPGLKHRVVVYFQSLTDHAIAIDDDDQAGVERTARALVVAARDLAVDPQLPDDELLREAGRRALSFAVELGLLEQGEPF